MSRKTPLPSFDPHLSLGTDYVLIGTGIGAAAIALVYLLLF
jgi:hypothetical protein